MERKSGQKEIDMCRIIVKYGGENGNMMEQIQQNKMRRQKEQQKNERGENTLKIERKK